MEQLQFQILKRYQNMPLLIGLQGMQGVGKTTMGNNLKKSLLKQNISFESVSIDDFYLSFENRQKLDQNKYKYRGPPGTHDWKAIINCLQQFKQGKTISVPNFDKSLHNGLGDRNGERTISAQILLFEGWFVGYQSQALQTYYQSNDTPQLLYEKKYDKEIELYFNEQLKNYEQIWSMFDILVQYRPIKYELSLKWRLEAEQEMRQKEGKGMSDQQIIDFVSYFWNCLHPQIYNNMKCDILIEVDEQREKQVKVM